MALVLVNDNPEKEGESFFTRSNDSTGCDGRLPDIRVRTTHSLAIIVALLHTHLTTNFVILSRIIANYPRGKANSFFFFRHRDYSRYALLMRAMKEIQRDFQRITFVQFSGLNNFVRTKLNLALRQTCFVCFANFRESRKFARQLGQTRFSKIVYIQDNIPFSRGASTFR